MADRLWQLNQRSRRLIDGLLELAQSEQGIRMPEEVDLAAAVQDASEAMLPEVQARGLHIEQELQAVKVPGDRTLLERLAGNLIENAVRHNIAGGWVRVATRVEDGQAVFTVENTGPTLAPADVPSLFEPFRRGAQERTDSGKGAGLGLSIVRAVARAHAGKVEATARQDGGLLISVRLPRNEG